MSDFWHATYQVARNEILQHLRTKRMLVVGALLLVSLVLMTIVFPITLFELDQADVEGEFAGEGVALENFAFFLFLNFPLVGGYMFMQILSIILTADAVSGEWQRKTLFLVLSKPVPRAALVMGKFLGAVIPLVTLFLLMFLIDYAILNMVYPGNPSGEQVGRFFGAVGMILLGAVAFATMGLFFSTITKSGTGSLIWSLAMGLLLFPILGAIGDFTRAGDDFAGEASDPKYDWSHYLTPNHVMTKAGDVLLGADLEVQFSLVPTTPAASLPGIIGAGFGLILLFLVGSLLVVQIRNFE